MALASQNVRCLPNADIALFLLTSIHEWPKSVSHSGRNADLSSALNATACAIPLANKKAHNIWL
jgi:hypothetical protein